MYTAGPTRRPTPTLSPRRSARSLRSSELRVKTATIAESTNRSGAISKNQIAVTGEVRTASMAASASTFGLKRRGGAAGPSVTLVMAMASSRSVTHDAPSSPRQYGSTVGPDSPAGICNPKGVPWPQPP